MEKITRNYLTKKFNEFNTRFFEGKLPSPIIITNNSYRALGLCGYKGGLYNNATSTWTKQPHHYIKISTFHKREEREVLNTLLHEMIHLHFHFIGKLKVKHGREFQEMARSFDAYGFNVHTTSMVDNSKDKEDFVSPIHMIKFIDTNGVVWLCRMNEKYEKNIINTIKNRSYTEIELFETRNKMFGSYKNCRKRIGGQIFTKNTFGIECLPYLTKIPLM